MESRKEIALSKHSKGYNCVQAVACTYADLVDADELSIFRTGEALGLGMGGMEGTCGAISGACMLAGLKISTGNLETPNSKGLSYKYSKEIVNQFKEMNGATLCKDLKGKETGVVLRPCSGCITDACEIVERVLFAD